jgi:hypothetical protein
MESPGRLEVVVFSGSGDLGVFGNIVFPVEMSISVYVAAFVGYISVAAVTAT